MGHLMCFLMLTRWSTIWVMLFRSRLDGWTLAYFWSLSDQNAGFFLSKFLDYWCCNLSAMLGPSVFFIGAFVLDKMGIFKMALMAFIVPKVYCCAMPLLVCCLYVQECLDKDWLLLSYYSSSIERVPLHPIPARGIPFYCFCQGAQPKA